MKRHLILNDICKFAVIFSQYLKSNGRLIKRKKLLRTILVHSEVVVYIQWQSTFWNTGDNVALSLDTFRFKVQTSLGNVFSNLSQCNWHFLVRIRIFIGFLNISSPHWPREMAEGVGQVKVSERNESFSWIEILQLNNLNLKKFKIVLKSESNPRFVVIIQPWDCQQESSFNSILKLYKLFARRVNEIWNFLAVVDYTTHGSTLTITVFTTFC